MLKNVSRRALIILNDEGRSKLVLLEEPSSPEDDILKFSTDV
jgi:hypothetical protein